MHRPLLLSALLLISCGEKKPPPATAAAPDAGPSDLPDRRTFNQIAAQIALPLFWVEDDGNGQVDPTEIALLNHGPWGANPPPALADGKLTPTALRMIDRVRVIATDGHPDIEPTEEQRRAVVLAELDLSRPTLIQTDLTAHPELARHMLSLASDIDRLHWKQTGGFPYMAAAVNRGDDPSAALTWRNHGPWCLGQQTSTNPDCSGDPARPPRVAGVYPAQLQASPDFCDGLQEQGLLDPFTAVVAQGDGTFAARPYSEVWADRMGPIATELEAVAATLPEDEAAFALYLRTAATAFRTNDWFAADAAWAEMSADNSQWYLRIGPDETYWDPCNRKAGFHMVFARTNPGSRAWKQKLEPLRTDLEGALAALSGPPYEAREVAFDMPEFIDIILNAGDARQSSGATIGQSLPNWGPVADAGGRTVAMANLFTDADSIAAHKTKVTSLFCEDAMALYTDDGQPMLMTTILHEAAHNLGPAQNYKVDGKTDEDAFGGPVAAVFEELKAQTASLYLTDWLVERGVVERPFADQAHFADIAWALGNIADGFVDSEGATLAYSQLAGIQVGFLLDQGALAWHPDQPAANGTDTGCFSIDTDGLPAAIDALGHEVFSIKATLDADRAKALRDQHVNATGERGALWTTVTERWLRTQDATFVYSVAY